MSVYQNMNQLTQTATKGMVDMIPNPHTISCQILPTSANNLVAASPVKLVAGTSNQIMVDLAGPTDMVLGFVTFNQKKVKFTGGDKVEVGLSGTIMTMESGGAFNRGQTLEVVNTGTLVIANVHVNTVVGVSLNTATKAGELIRVYVSNAGDVLSSSSSSCSSSSSSCRSSSSSSRSSSSSSSSSSSAA